MNFLNAIAAQQNERRRKLLAGSRGLPAGPPSSAPPYSPDDPSFDVMGELEAARPLETRRRAPEPPNLPPTPTPTPGAMEPPGGELAMPPMEPARQSRYGELQEAKDVYLKGTPSRRKSLLLGALRGGLQGLASGQGLGAGLGGAVAGAIGGGVNPRGLREMEFDERIRPKIQERWGFENYESAARAAAEDRMLRKRQAESGIDLQRSQIERNRRPPIATPRAPQLKLGRDRRTGEMRYFNAADPQEAQNFEPAEFEREEKPRPHWVRDERGRFVNLNDPALAGKPVRGYDRPRVGRQPKAEKKYASIDDVREAAEAAGITTSRMKAKFIEKGYTVIE